MPHPPIHQTGDPHSDVAGDDRHAAGPVTDGRSAR